MKTTATRPCSNSHPAALLQFAEPSRIQRIRRLIDAARAARAGTGQMTLSDWRDVEQEVKRRLNYQCQKIQQ